MPCATGGPGSEERGCSGVDEPGNPAAWSPSLSAKRQRERVHRQDGSEVALGESDQDDLYRARQPVAERLRGELPRTPAGRMPQP